MHRIVVLALDDVIAFDLSTPVEILGRAVDGDGAALYRVRVAGPDEFVRSGPVRLGIPHRLAELWQADTIIAPGRSDPTAPLGDDTIDALQDAARRGVRIASICVGALDLAATGLLDGMRATTHWRAAGLLAARHDRVEVTPDALFVDNGQIRRGTHHRGPAHARG
jgi:transcriptional regulator GlxA family with amidase domain